MAALSGRASLVRALGSSELAWLLAVLRRRFERGGREEGRLALPPTLAGNELEALQRLLGRRLDPGARSIGMEELGRVLAGAGLSDSLRDAVESLTGPCLDLRGQREREREEWSAVYSSARARLDAHPALSAWLDELERGGFLRRCAGGDAARARTLLGQVLAIATRLPAREIALAQLAADHTGDSHALDAGSPLGALALRAAAAVSGFEGALSDPAGRRAGWESVGVYCDELSSSVLVLNLQADPGSLCGSMLSSHAALGEPCRLTLRELLRHPPVFGPDLAGSSVFVCENPTVLAAAADRLGPRSRPLVCVEGNPRVPAMRLLRTLAASGARLLYHGDFDWEGVRIANRVMSRVGAAPWRLSARDYREAAARGGSLSGRPAVADWDPLLEASMSELGRAVHEEAVIAELCGDLS